MASTSYNQTQSSSVLSSPPTQYDVFLSFRGQDTRYRFTDHLYNALNRIGIRTFRDNPELGSGERISRILPQAIRESKTYVIVFSENYASSKWCLDELVQIYNCHKTTQRSIIPVFYNIDPSVVRYQDKSFGEAFEKHRVRFEMEKVNKWQHTLTKVADFSGYHISENRYEADFINEIVDRILYETNPKTLDVAKYPVGLDPRVNNVMALLRSGTEGVIRIGLYGMGGVGKTTLAKAVFNQYYHSFEGSCFLANVRVVSQKEKGIVCLQQKLVNDILKRKNINIDDVDQGTELIRTRICSKKVLIVIDDLNDRKVLEHLVRPFASGSAIIITTRNEDLLDAIEIEARYKVNELDDVESLLLFTQHAFGNNKISDAFMEMSREILERAGGLPLALKFFGSNLHNQSEEGWKWFINKLQRVPVNDVEKNLLISYTALELENQLQDIFLDIACFFIGHEEQEIMKIMETCYSLVSYSINILKKRSLLTIRDKDKLGMHHLLQDMGKKIARNSYPNEPGKHSRLWITKDICDVLKKQEGTEAIQGIVPENLLYHQDAHEGVSFASETFERMSKLRLLYLENVNITGRFDRAFEDLRLFFWKCCPLKYLPSDFYPQKLVTLSLPCSKMKTVWELNKVSQVFEMLKTLNMPYSLELTTTPDFTKLPNLETLNLEGCKSLEEVHISIGSLEKLVSLNLCGCVNLRSLPDTFCNLIKLEILCIANCSSLQAFFKELGNIEFLKPGKVTRLRELDAGGATLFKKLCSCQFLNQKNLILEPGKVTRLRELDSGGANLDFKECCHLLSILELPPNLKQIKADGCSSLKRLPNLFNLKNLEVLTLKDCNGLTEIQGLEKLTSIRKLHVGGCNSSLLRNTLTECIFQMYSGFGHQIQVYTSSAEFPDWIHQSNNLGLRVSLNFPSHNLLAMILCFKQWEDNLEYHVENITNDIVWKDSVGNSDKESLIVLLPRAIFSVKEGDNNIIVNATAELCRVHILFKTELRNEYNNTDVGDDRSCPSKRLKH